MRITITNDEGEVYTIATNVHDEDGNWVALDDELDEVRVADLLIDAAIWERSDQ